MVIIIPSKIDFSLKLFGIKEFMNTKIKIIQFLAEPTQKYLGELILKRRNAITGLNIILSMTDLSLSLSGIRKFLNIKMKITDPFANLDEKKLWRINSKEIE